MPLIRLTHPRDAFTPEQKQALAERLTELLLRIEGGADTPHARTLAYVLFVELPRSDWFIGGRCDATHQAGAERLIAEVVLPEASTTQTMKDDIHVGVNAALVHVLGWDRPDAGINAWVLVHEIPEGHWGAQGESFGLARIAAFTQSPPDQARTAFIKSYFKAKAAAFAAAGYPADVSGLFRRPEARP